jgi:hypothetical protein
MIGEGLDRTANTEGRSSEPSEPMKYEDEEPMEVKYLEKSNKLVLVKKKKKKENRFVRSQVVLKKDLLVPLLAKSSRAKFND